ncbi:TetR/AcrR family transcriptional regulator [Streptomyces litchfieldiae]|uniref:Helix-turn-helix domain-containing protein n=1 Tax=Streptomyces litchfieldiae TaxID=3075543 RepID=A0ABU2MHR0_9ACTN|nr:helix-turn-helix domain-containing protein [Streptomyces sp. DSM 44938]MDT0341137.1 helix-turn-helix domain-containing protein [Streptomyces sp. DSM 44938]
MAEHRRMQRAALLDAARSLLAEGGVRALTFPALAERTGLARSSVYEYFPSRTALVEELCASDFPLWAAEIEAAMAAADTPRQKIEAYVRHQLALAADDRHRALVAVKAEELGAAARAGTPPDGGAWERIGAAHAGLTDLVVEVLRDLGHQEPRLAATLLQGVVDAAVKSAAPPAGRPADLVAETAVRLALDGVAGGLLGERDTLGGQQPGGSAA